MEGWLKGRIHHELLSSKKKGKIRTLNFENGKTKKWFLQFPDAKKSPLLNALYGFTECSRTTVKMKMNNMDIGSVELFLSKAGNI